MREISVALPLPETEKQRSEAFDEAYDAAARGWSVIPCEGKKPDIQLLKAATGETGWKQYQEHCPSLANLLAWSDAEGFGLVTGKVSGLVVLDVDPGGKKALKGKPLPETVTAHTPRGFHYLFKQPKNLLHSSINLLGKNSHIDLKAEGGYVVLPGTTGRTWVQGMSPADIPLADCPDWLLKAAKTKPKTEPLSLPLGMGKAGEVASNKYLLLSTSTIPTSAGPLKEGRLTHFFRDIPSVLTMAKVIGIDVDQVGQAFLDILPSQKPDTKPSASLYQHPGTNLVLYRSWRSATEGLYTLGEVRASQAYGKPVKLVQWNAEGGIKKLTPEHAAWSLLVIVEAGLVRPADVPHRPLPKVLPDTAPYGVRLVYDGFLLLLACKWLHTKGAPSLFTHSFAGRWCGLGENQATAAKKWLLKKGYLQILDKKYKKWALFMPGEIK